MWKGEEAAFAKNGTLPDPEGIANRKFVLQWIKDSSPIDAAKRTHMAKYWKCVSEETMTEKRMEKNEEVKEEEVMGGHVPLRKSGPDDMFGQGKYHGKTFREMYFDGSQILRLDSETRQASDVEIEVFQILRT